MQQRNTTLVIILYLAFFPVKKKDLKTPKFTVYPSMQAGNRNQTLPGEEPQGQNIPAVVMEVIRKTRLPTGLFKWYKDGNDYVIVFAKKPKTKIEVSTLLDFLMSSFEPDLAFYEQADDGSYYTKWVFEVDINDLDDYDLARLIEELGKAADWVSGATAHDYDFEYDVDTITIGDRKYKYIQHVYLDKLSKYIDYYEELQPIKDDDEEEG